MFNNIIFRKGKIMTATLHLATGAASALFVQKYFPVKRNWIENAPKNFLFTADFINLNCVFVFFAGLLSHIFFDSFSHTEYSLQGQALMLLLCLEGFVTSLLVLFGQNSARFWLLVWGMIGAALPDALHFAGEYFNFEWFRIVHSLLHVYHGTIDLVLVGHFSEMVLVAVSIIYIRVQSA
ncbi:MAG: hypothetical protein COV30_00265 [Candidatus Yanofskybacteria bacterium CG10_big_fil_rev_8_21_14_0_10_37_15]|uniref:Uncharacterized protein n=1 Tax=Candidatus Yanofskybacteria bacterium CG10_big_fil_rev_8_21_14_0_10_37_15 TaxID=1975097 RepID=A0A2H0R6L8_9BACT|nr:MAG: hypothetical protein COV30_00265 [Candidatus Yanofskybacteria bacterium CG10_big_fil_rev_8_21_14_0_10_37_15]